MNLRSRISNLLRSTKNFGLGFILMPLRLFNHSNNKTLEFSAGFKAFGYRYYLKWNIDRLGWIYIQGHGFYSQQSGQIAISSDIRKKLTVVWISAFSIEKRVFEIESSKIKCPEIEMVHNRFLLDSTNPKTYRILTPRPTKLSLNVKVKPFNQITTFASFRLKSLSNPGLHEIQ